MTDTVQKKEIKPNDKQKLCIETINGTVMVLAGPGTGKTFTIIQRIKYMLQQGINAEEILCLTYSEAAANEMKSRLVGEIGTIAAAVTVNTYHAFCNEIIKAYPMKFDLLEGVTLIDDISKRDIMKAAVDDIKPKAYKTKWGDSYYFIPELLKQVTEIKSNQVTKEEYFNTLNTHPEWQGKADDLAVEYAEREKKGKLVATFLTKVENHIKKMEKAKETWEIYENYDEKMKQNNFIDFNDMINLVIEVFEKDEDFLSKVASKYKYFLVDEYQDTNYSQNQIVFKLAEGAKSENIFVVGDDDQIIFEFQGAKRDTLEKFLKLYPNTKVICLNENNRSTQNILDFSYEVISSDRTRLEFNPEFKTYNISKTLTAMNAEINKKNKKIQMHGFADLKQEYNYIVKDIENLIKSDEFPVNKDNPSEKNLSQIAVLTRKNAELADIANLLEAKNIQYQIKANKSIFDVNSSILIYFYLKALQNNELYADKLYAVLLSKPFEFAVNDYNILLEKNRINHKDLVTNIREFLDVVKWENKEIIEKFIKDFDYLKKAVACNNIKNLIIEVINRTGILQYYLESEINRSDNIYAINKIIKEAQGCMYRNPATRLYDFLNHIDTAFKSNIPILIDKEEYTQNAVQLLTLHSSKGREFEYVYMPGLTAKNWEQKKVNSGMTLPICKDCDNTNDEEAKKSEELRLLFVGITRAKHSLFMSFSNAIDSNPQELTKYLSSAVKNENITETHNHTLSKDEYLFEVATALEKSKFDYKTAFNDEIRARIKEFILSPSSLNSYLNCPRNFLYSEIMKIPVFEDDVSNAHYGSAIHKTLEQSVRIAKQTGNYPSKEAFIEIFEKNLSEKEINTKEKREELVERGKTRLENFYKHFISTPVENITATEFYIDHVPYKKHFIKGFVDRIEKNSLGEYEVYDYKTGGAKPKTQIADGKEYESYLNQLRFYKYAFEKLNPNEKVKKAGLIFVEEPSKNYYIELCEEDNKIIEEKIDFAYKNIDLLNFNPPEQSEKTCSYCKYKQMCKLNLF